MPTTRTYPANWQQIRRLACLRAGFRCEWCGMFFNPQYKSIGITRRDGRPYILTVHHANDNSMDNSPKNLIALCQVCHCKAECWTEGAAIPRRWQTVPQWILAHELAYTWQMGLDHA